MRESEFLQELIKQGSCADEGYFQFAHIVACRLDKKLHESLEQLINGPVYDGDVVSKTYRDELLWLGLATRVCCKGEQGHTGATYFASPVMKAVINIRSGRIGA